MPVKILKATASAYSNGNPELPEQSNAVAFMKKIIGYVLFIWSFLAWGATFAVPFIGLQTAHAVAVATGLIISAEVAFVLSIVLLGKDIWKSVKAFFQSKSTGTE